jgi:rSAM/selenodomain-associated transferase 2/rSAM/selenodomain-associated transferase 1
VTIAGSLSVVLPVLNEEQRLPALLKELQGLAAEVVVVDGGSTDATAAIAERCGARLVRTAPGRGTQLRAGADAARSEWLFFLHADCRVTAAVRAALGEFLSRAQSDEYAHFRFALEGQGPFLRFIEFGQALREWMFGLPYGDQGLLVSRTLYDAVSGYPDWPLMEDVGILDRLRRRGRRIALPTRLETSARRYQTEGRIRGWLRNLALMTLFRCGASPDRLVRWYDAPRSGREAEQDTQEARAIVIFAKAPVPGRVKTRLAADVGAKEATRIYRRLGRETADALRDAPGRLIVYVDPPEEDAVATVAEWLGSDGLEFRLQSSGDLGTRLSEAVEECLVDNEMVCIVGSDIPGIESGTVQAAFDALGENDLALGPATDGGYYLIAMRTRNPDVFSGIPWSTPDVLETTLERASALDLRVALLGPKTDVDTIADVPEALLAG